MLPPNVRVDMNCQPTWVTQNAIPVKVKNISEIMYISYHQAITGPGTGHMYIYSYRYQTDILPIKIAP